MTVADRTEGHQARCLPHLLVLRMLARDEGEAPRYVTRLDGDRYSLIAWCVMPNHVHALIAADREYNLDRIVHSWKSYTGNQANRLVQRSGAFWAREYFDRFMRDADHLARTAAYIEGNPVKAGLCENVSEWRFSSAWEGWAEGNARGARSAGFQRACRQDAGGPKKRRD